MRELTYVGNGLMALQQAWRDARRLDEWECIGLLLIAISLAVPLVALWHNCFGGERRLVVILMLAPTHMLFTIAAAATVRHPRHHVMPISFSIPRAVWLRTEALRASGQKTHDWASIIPGRRSTYTFQDEYHYYDAYARARYAVTMRKAGWDCLRHYEIVAAGAVPFMLGIASMPPLTMTTWPRRLIQQLMSLPGMPSEAHVTASVRSGGPLPPINHSRFPEDRYHRLRRALLAHATQRMLAVQTAQRLLHEAMADSASAGSPRAAALPCSEVLVHSHNSSSQPLVDFQRDLLVIGLIEAGVRTVHVSFEVEHLFDSFAAHARARLYGRGFTIAGALPASQRQRVRSWGVWSASTAKPCVYVKTTFSNSPWPREDLVSSPSPIYVDGNDIGDGGPLSPWHPRKWSYLRLPFHRVWHGKVGALLFQREVPIQA